MNTTLKCGLLWDVYVIGFIGLSPGTLLYPLVSPQSIFFAFYTSLQTHPYTATATAHINPP
jgi:hypothetical protein